MVTERIDVWPFSISAGDLAERMRVDPARGFAEQEVTARQMRYGAKELRHQKPTSPVTFLAHQFSSVTNLATSREPVPPDALASSSQVFEYAFDPTLKMMASVNTGGRTHLFAIKGAPESVIERCAGVFARSACSPPQYLTNKPPKTH